MLLPVANAFPILEPWELRSFFVVASLRWQIIWPPVIEMSMDGPLRMVCRIFHAVNYGSFVCLISFGEFFHRLFIRVGDIRQSLYRTRLSSAPRSHLTGIAANLIKLRLIVAFQFL